jgi:hypothetical protein
MALDCTPTQKVGFIQYGRCVEMLIRQFYASLRVALEKSPTGKLDSLPFKSNTTRLASTFEPCDLVWSTGWPLDSSPTENL